MSRNISLPTPMYKQIFDRKSIFFSLLVMACMLSASLIFVFWIQSWTIWILGFLIIAAWMPFVLSTMRTIYQQHPWFSFLYLLVISQIAHMLEHLAQMVEMHILGMPGSRANGIIGFLNTEWVHLIWNSWVLVAVFMLLFVYRRNKWLWALFVFAIYHEVEHIYIVSVYVKTGIAGTPGLLARGGLIGGGLPIIRPDLHALYAVLEVAMLLMIYFGERRKIRSVEAQRAQVTQIVAD